MILKAIKNEYESTTLSDIDPWRAWRACGDIPAFWLETSRGVANEQMAPHRLHNTMKANSTSAESVAEELDHDEWLAQTKYDGARLFVHHNGDGTVRAYSGGGNDVTAALPEIKEMDWPDCSFIFDAEATPYDADGNVIPFENIMTRLTREVDPETVSTDDYDTEVVFKFFDCMYWRGRDITKRMYTDRWTIVKSVFGPENLARTGEDLESTFHSSIEAGHEGLVLKKKDGEYMPGGRHGQWLKWKPEPETLDVMVLDVQRGSGRISDRMGALEVGLLHRGDTEHVGCVGTGFSDEERKKWWLAHETGEARGKVIEIEFEEFQPNSGGWGLRFPSYQRRRPDGEVDTVERAAKLQNRHDDYEEWRKGK
jgi:DNA ligase-1